MNEISRPGVNFGGAGLGTKIEFAGEEKLAFLLDRTPRDGFEDHSIQLMSGMKGFLRVVHLLGGCQRLT